MLQSKINRVYEKHSGQRVCQGDIFRDISFDLVIDDKVITVFFPYIIVISQDCDLNTGYKVEGLGFKSQPCEFNQFLPNILFLPAFIAESVKDGKHLIDVFNIIQEKINSERWKIIKQNNNERYHFLQSYSDLQIPDLVIDFKNYYTLPTGLFFSKYQENYLATVNELFREKLSQRFSFYLSRIGLPEIG